MVGPNGGWRNDRLETSYREARTVLSGQQDAIQDIDNKAMYTNRVIVVFIGILVAAAQIGDAPLFDRALLTIGSSLLFVAFAIGVVTYSFTDLFTGPNRRYLRQLVEGDVDADSWDTDLIYRMGDWITKNHGDIRLFTRLLLAEQVTMLLGVGAVLLSVGL